MADRDEPQTPTKTTREPPPKRLREFEGGAHSKERKTRGALLAANLPSYCLKTGVGSLQSGGGGGESLRNQHRKTLWLILHGLMLRHDWADASGVLAVLIRGTVADRSLATNRAKYSAALELLDKIKGETLSSRRIQGVYELWMKKVGSLKDLSTKEKFAVQLEFILTCLQRGSMEDAYQAALCVMQESGFDSDPVANLVVGLTFYQLWYNDLPKELQLTDQDSCDTHMQPEVPVDGINVSIDHSNDNDALDAGGARSVLQCDSNTSVAVDKVVEDDGSQRKESMDIDDNVKKETSYDSSQPQESYMKSAEASGNSNHSFSHYSGDLPHASIFYSQGLPSWILPMKLPSSHENLEDAVHKHRKLHNNNYKSALKYLRVALYSTPPIAEALHPLIQMLLLGDQVQEALDELENSSHSLHTLLQLRLKASLLEHFDAGNYVELCTCFEDILNKDPTCSDSLERLILMHRRGDYDIQSLVEMVALHLDASYGTCDTWQELASCFLKLSECEEDRFSTCGDCNDPHSEGDLENSNKIPQLFTNGESGNAWSLRARWWLNCHFNDRILTSDIASGDLKLLTYKAAAASHIYGRHFKYVVKDMFTAATETSSGTIDWAMAELMRNPHVRAKAQAEVRQAFKDGKTIDENEVGKLKYIKLVVKEALRLHPAAPLLSRASREDSQINGYDIPAKTKVLVNNWGMGRNPKYFPNPERFEPERFENNGIDFNGANFEYLPFGAGKRMCPGITFGLASVEVPLAHLLYHFDWELPKGVKQTDLDMTENPGISAPRKNHLRVIATPYRP